MRTNRWVVGLLVAGLVASIAAADVERDQEAIALAWIGAHNAADVDEMAAFRAEHFQRSTVDDWQPGYRSMVAELGKLDVFGVMIEKVGRLEVGVDASGLDEQVRLVFEFHDDDPTQLRQISLENAADRAADLGLPTVDFSPGWEAREGELDAYLEQLAADGLFSGSVLIARRDGVLFAGAYGLASREFDAPNTLATRFDVGSCNKDYTRLAILQLAGAGKLALDDRVGKHLPDYPNADVRDRVTVRQLIDHTSGLGDYFDEKWWETPMGRLREIDDYIPIWGPEPLLSEPGEREMYSNYGYTVLGAIIEKVSGQSYPDYVVEHVFEPAGMSDSGFFATDAVVPNVAVGYTHFSREGRREEPVKNIYLEPAKGGPWGKSYSTAHDLYRFYDAMLKDTIPSGGGNWMKGGWERGSMAFAGGGPGLSAICLIEDGLMVVVLANMDMPIAEVLAETLSRQLR